MRQLAPAELKDAAPVAETLSTEEYVRLLHPTDSIGAPTIQTKEWDGGVNMRTCSLLEAPFWATCVLDHDAYISLHRFHGRRRVSRLASLNGLFLDLDANRVHATVSQDWALWALDVSIRIAEFGLPEPTFTTFTGRGLAAIWLIGPLPPAALPRWQSVQNALIDMFRSCGADPKCRDAARVTRLPGSVNSKSGKVARIIGGSCRRYQFDPFADAIYSALGRPTREQLRRKTERKDRRKQSIAPPGITPHARFQAIMRDLERVRQAWGGSIPIGRRNTWLHLYATCVSHTAAPHDVEALVKQAAELATPDLPQSEVRSLTKSAVSHAALPATKNPLHDGRYHYSGATIAELLDISGEASRALGLEQVMPPEERARRKAEREQQRRRRAGAVDRDAWRADNDQEQRKPWADLGVSRATYFRLKSTGKLPGARGDERAD